MVQEETTQQIKYKLINELKDPWLWIYFLMVAVALILLKYNFECKTVKIIAFVLFPAAQLLYILKGKKIQTNPEYLKWMSFVILTLYAIIYISFMVGELNITLVFFIFAALLIFIFSILQWGFLLFKSEKTWMVVTSYVFFTIVFITFFGFLYALLSGFSAHQILDSEGNSVKTAGGLIDYSWSVYYTSVEGYTAYGYSKILKSIEIMISFIMHTILLGRIINKLK